MSDILRQCSECGGWADPWCPYCDGRTDDPGECSCPLLADEEARADLESTVLLLCSRGRGTVVNVPGEGKP